MKIKLKNLSSVPVEHQAAFHKATGRLAKVIIGTATGIPNQLVFTIKVLPIDKKGKTLAYADIKECHHNACYSGHGDLPWHSEIVMDLADIDMMAEKNTIESTIFHEELHAASLGGYWQSRGLIIGSGTDNPEYIGKNALREYQELKGDHTITGIPLESTGGAGTSEMHWSQEVFGNEVFTGFDTGSYQPLSRMTIGALEDLGYIVDYSQADPYMLHNVGVYEGVIQPTEAANEEIYKPDAA